MNHHDDDDNNNNNNDDTKVRVKLNDGNDSKRDDAEYAEIYDKSKNDDNAKTNKKKRKKGNLFMPLAILMLNAAVDKKICDQREFYSKFYTASCIQPRIFCHAKKYEIERKHKVKKRDLLNDKLSNNAISGCGKYFTLSQVTTIATVNDNIRSEGESEME